MKTRNGFTLIELLVVIVIIGILVAIALPNFIKVKEKAKEAETKQNLHSIQLSVERYATDSQDGIYPGYLFGGDYTDSFTVNQLYVNQSGLTATDWPVNKPQQLGSDRCADVLILEGYMTQYPKNPFIQRGSIANTSGQWSRRLVHFGNGGTQVTRYVGGKDASMMVDIAGPPPGGACVSQYAGDVWILPPYQAPPGTSWDDSSNADRTVNPSAYAPYSPEPGNSRLPGNFYYYSILSIKALGWITVQRGDPVGYHLAAYGTLKNLGLDVYDATGEYVEDQRILPCDTRGFTTGGSVPGMPCPSAGEDNSYHNRSRGGPDAFKDGVIIVLDSGTDKKSTSGEATSEQG
jgi:prepilin-type N-terminal cleavage/methylation domain-containing protein